LADRAPVEEGCAVVVRPLVVLAACFVALAPTTDEIQRTTAPLTTAISSREYEVAGTFSGSLTGPESADPPEGTLEVGYQIGCGIDMSTSNGVSLTGTMGLSPSIGVIGTDLVSPIPKGSFRASAPTSTATA
jgi:MspA